MVELQAVSMVGGTAKATATAKAKPFHEGMIQVEM
jgi:hypothetical protein